MLIWELLNIIRSADNMAAIQPFAKDDPVNSICHASHIVAKRTEYEHYFPEIKCYYKRYHTKCRITISISIQEIKDKVVDQLRYHENENEKRMD